MVAAILNMAVKTNFHAARRWMAFSGSDHKNPAAGWGAGGGYTPDFK